MRAKQATRAGTVLESANEVTSPRLHLRGARISSRGKGGGGEVDIDSSKSEQRQEEDEVYEASIVATILIINNWKPLRF